MKRIKILQAFNFQGQNFNETLAPVTLIAGPNFSGKTSRVNAAILALTGGVPNVAKKSNEVYDRMATGDPMRVKIGFEDDTTIARSYSKNKDSVKAEVVGVATEWPAISFDAMEFFGLSEKDRVKFVFARATLPEEYSIVKLTATITANLKNIKVENNTEATEAEIAKLVTLLSATTGSTPQEWLSKLVEDVRGKKLLADQNVKRQEGTVQGLAQNRSTEAVAPDAEHKLAEARKAQEAAASMLASAKAVHGVLVQRLREYQELESLTASESVDRNRAAEVEKMIAEIVVGERPSDKDQMLALRDAGGRKTEATLAESRTSGALERAEKAVKEAEAMTCCPTCGSDISAKRDAILITLRAALAEAKAANEKALDAYNVANEAWDKADGEMEAVQKLQQAHDSKADMRRELSDELARLQAKLAKTAGAAELVAKIPALKSEISERATEVTNHERQVEEKRGDVSKWDLQSKRLQAARAEALASTKAINECEKAKAAASVAKKAVEMLAELQERLVAAAIGPIIASCNTLVDGVLNHAMTYKDGDVGLSTPTGFVGWRTMSGAQRALAFCAISLALSAGAPFRLAIIDELGRLDAVNKIEVAKNIMGLLNAGKIDQAILVDTDAAPYRSTAESNFEIFEIIELKKEVA